MPGDAETVLVAAGHSVTADVASASLSAFTLDGALVCIGWDNKLTSGDVVINGTVTHPMQSDVSGTVGVYADWTPDNRVWIICSNLTVSATGIINADFKGYQPDTTLYRSGRGPGGGPYTVSSSSQGTRIHGVTAWSANSAVVLDGAAVTFVEPGFLLDVAALSITEGRLELTARSVTVAGDLALQNNASLYLTAPATNDNPWPYTRESGVREALETAVSAGQTKRQPRRPRAP